MEWFRNRKTMTKLMIGYLAVAALLVVVGANGLRQMSTVKDHMQDLYDNRFACVLHVAQIRASMLRSRARVLQHVMATDAGLMQDDETAIQKLDGNVDDQLRACEATTLVEEERQAIATFKS